MLEIQQGKEEDMDDEEEGGSTTQHKVVIKTLGIRLTRTLNHSNIFTIFSRVLNAEYRMLSIECRVSNVEYQMSSIEC